MTIKLLTWIIMNYGLMNIVVYGSIFEKIREFIRKLGEKNIFLNFIYGIISCPMCFSTWSGFFMGIFLFSPVHNILGTSITYSWFFDGLVSSGSVWVINAIIEFFEENRIK